MLREETTLCLSSKHAEQHSDSHGSLTKRKSNHVTETDWGPLEYVLNLSALTPTWKYPKSPSSQNGQTVVLSHIEIFRNEKNIGNKDESQMHYSIYMTFFQVVRKENRSVVDSKEDRRILGDDTTVLLSLLS